MGWLVVAGDCVGLFDNDAVGFVVAVAVGFAVAALVTVGFIVDVGFVGFSVMTVVVRCVVVTRLISVVVRGFTLVVVVTLGTVETIPNDCAVVVFDAIGSETVVVLLDGLAVDTVTVAGVVNVVSGSAMQNTNEPISIRKKFHKVINCCLTLDRLECLQFDIFLGRGW